MSRLTTTVLVALLCIQRPTPAQTADGAGSIATNDANAVTIEQIGLEKNGDFIEIRYRIRNDSKQDIWLCETLGFTRYRFEVYLADDDETLVIRRRLAVPTSVVWSLAPTGAYVRLASGQARNESLLLRLPVEQRVVFASGSGRGATVLARRVVIEIGYYTGSPFHRLTESYNEKWASARGPRLPQSKRNEVRALGYALLSLNATSEGQGDRDERVLVSYGDPVPGPEQVLTTSIEDLSIPHRLMRSDEQVFRPNPRECVRLEIRYEPSMLDYFFPHQRQKDLLSTGEREYLRTQKTMVITDSNDICTLDKHIHIVSMRDYLVCEGRAAHITCHWDRQPGMLLVAYEGNVVDPENRRCYTYNYGTPGLREMTPQIQPFNLRIDCASNLRNLWHRMRLFYIAKNEGAFRSFAQEFAVYPSPDTWCDAMVSRHREERIYPGMTGPHACPSAGSGRSHYAMNSACEADSPGDMVLLFETKAGWNQYGGPELFTFDNHDPRGGCVLLNDGTVKFIRTERELHALRWR